MKEWMLNLRSMKENRTWNLNTNYTSSFTNNQVIRYHTSDGSWPEGDYTLPTSIYQDTPPYSFQTLTGEKPVLRSEQGYWMMQV